MKRILNLIQRIWGFIKNLFSKTEIELPPAGHLLLISDPHKVNDDYYYMVRGEDGYEFQLILTESLFQRGDLIKIGEV